MVKLICEYHLLECKLGLFMQVLLCSLLQRMGMGLRARFSICCMVEEFLGPKQSMVPCHHRLLGLQFKQVILLLLCSLLQHMDMGLDEH